MYFALEYPSLVDKLTVVDIAPFSFESHWDTEFMNYISLMKRMDLSRVKNRKDADSMLVNSIPDTMVRNFLLMNLGIDSESKYYWKPNLNYIEKELPKLREFNPKGKHFDGNTLFISGTRSNYIKKEHHSTIHQNFPNSKIVSLETGHWVHVEKPKEVIELIIDLQTKQ